MTPLVRCGSKAGVLSFRSKIQELRRYEKII
jgi:hypothetical protein